MNVRAEVSLRLNVSAIRDKLLIRIVYSVSVKLNAVKKGADKGVLTTARKDEKQALRGPSEANSPWEQRPFFRRATLSPNVQLPQSRRNVIDAG